MKKMQVRNLFKVAKVLMVLAVTLQVLVIASPALAEEKASAAPTTGEASIVPEGHGDGRGGEIVEALRQIAQVVVDIFIGISAILLAVGIVTGFVGGQFMVTVGQPLGLSHAWMRVISVVILGIAAMLTIAIVNTIINVMAGLIPATVIPSV